MGRNIGQTEISIEERGKIVDLTLSSSYSRGQIAEKLNRSTNTVWRYQKMYDLL